MNIVHTYYKEDDTGLFRAEIKENNGMYSIAYYKPDDTLIKEEPYMNKSLYFVESVIENWISGIKVLKG
jgi:hypothetical protein